MREREPGWEFTSEYAYLDIAASDLAFYQAVAVSDFEGERVYATLLYPERADQLTAYWAGVAPGSLLGKALATRAARGQDVNTVISILRSTLDGHLDTIVASRSWDGVVVGLTTSFSQLFANIALAQRIKAVAPTAIIVLGGSTVSPVSMADSVLATYPWVDYIVRGEGELPFHALCTRLATQALGERPPRGVVSRQIAAGESGMWQVDDLDALPIPNYDACYERVAPTGHGFLPIEGSRGCWWDRVVAKFPERAGVVNVRKHDLYAAVIDPAVLATLATFQLSFDHTETADWSRVVERVTRWTSEYRPHPLAYEDGGSYLRIYRRRLEDSDTFELHGEEAALYRYCLRIRRLPEIHAMFAGDSRDHASALDGTLARLVGQRLV